MEKDLEVFDKSCQTDDIDDAVEEKETNQTIKTTSFDTIVIPGGGIKGLYLLGALQYCYDNFLLSNIHTYVGTSSGAMICFLLTIGYTPVDIITQILSTQVIDKIQHFNIYAVLNNLGATSFSFVSEMLERMTIDKIGYFPTFADIKHKLNKNLVFVTYNLTKNEPEYLSYETHPSLPCLVAIRMSCNVPLLFDHYKYENQYYVDGGITDNFPLHHAQKYGKDILGIHVKQENMAFSPSDNFLQYIFKIINVPILQQKKDKFKSIHNSIVSNNNNSSSSSNTDTKYTIIDINDVLQENMFNFSVSNINKLNMFSAGYQQCKTQL